MKSIVILSTWWAGTPDCISYVETDRTGIEAEYFAAGLQAKAEGHIKHASTFTLTIVDDVQGEDEFESALRGNDKYLIVIHLFRPYGAKEFLYKMVYADTKEDAHNKMSHWRIKKEHDAGICIKLESDKSVRYIKDHSYPDAIKQHLPCWWCKFKAFMFG